MHPVRRADVATSQPPHPTQATSLPRARVTRHAAVCLLIACGMVALMRWWSWAWAPASIIAILYLMYASIEMAELRVRTLRDLSIEGPRPDTRSALVARERIGARILATLLIGAAAMALIVAALLLDSRTLGVGAAVTFGVVVFVGLPSWAAAVGDSMPQGRR